MNNNSDIELLKDLATLILKHGPDKFNALGSRLRSGELIESLIIVIEESSKATRNSAVIGSQKTPHKNSNKKASTFGNKTLIECIYKHPEKEMALREIHKLISQKTIFKTVRDIHTFIESNNLESIPKNSREKSISSLIKSISEAPLSLLDNLIEKSKENETSDQRELEGWTSIILNKNTLNDDIKNEQ